MLTTLLGLTTILSVATGVAAKLGMVDIKKSFNVPILNQTVDIEFSKEHPIKFDIQ